MTKMKTKYAEYPSLRLYDRLGVPYIVTGERWGGPLWTGHCMMLCTTDGYGDEGFLHELMHWIEASPNQRRYPDFALGKWVNADNSKVFATSTSDHLYDPVYQQQQRPKGNRNWGWGEPTIALSTATSQETTACYGMFLYHVLVGNTTWSKPITPTAVFDFMGGSLPSPEIVARRTAKIVTTLVGRTVPSKKVADYVRSIIYDDE